MNEIIGRKYVLKSGSYLADLESVDFITWRKDGATGYYRMKMHIGAKEVRYVCNTCEELQQVLTDWTRLQGKEIEMETQNVGCDTKWD